MLLRVASGLISCFYSTEISLYISNPLDFQLHSYLALVCQLVRRMSNLYIYTYSCTIQSKMDLCLANIFLHVLRAKAKLFTNHENVNHTKLVPNSSFETKQCARRNTMLLLSFQSATTS